MSLKKAMLAVALAGLVFAGRASAQDIIHTVDMRPIEAKVLEISEDYIWYKTFDNLTGPDYKLSVSRVTKIVFENGTVRLFATDPLFGLQSPHAYDDFGPYGPIDYRWGRYYDRRGLLISSEQIADYIGISLYGSEYMKAKSQYTWGMCLTTGGAACIAGAIIGGAMNAEFNRFAAGVEADMGLGRGLFSDGWIYVAGGVAGAALLGVGIPLWIKGNRSLYKIADDYNRNYGRGRLGYEPSLELGLTGNGIGLTFRF